MEWQRHRRFAGVKSPQILIGPGLRSLKKMLAKYQGIFGAAPERGHPGGAYLGGRSSLLSQPITLSAFSGSGPSQSKHWKVRFPLPSGGSAKTIGAPHSGHVGRLAWPIVASMNRSVNDCLSGV